VRLPYPVNPDRIRARYEQGILRVELPRSDESKPRKIQVEA
jgi:HSP20 family protein